MYGTVPEEAYILLQNQLQGALQLLAAYTLSSEELQLMGKNPEWAMSMRRELESTPHYKVALLQELHRHDFLTNTHPGYPLGLLKGPVAGHNTMNLFRTVLELAQQAPFKSLGENESWLQNNLPSEYSLEDEEVRFVLGRFGKCLLADRTCVNICGF